MASYEKMKMFAKEIRKDILKMTYEKKTGFIGTAFSCADILAVLYSEVVNIDYNNMDDKNNDVVIMSKGHGAVGWYAALAEAGAIPKEKLDKEFGVSGYKMGVHPKRNSVPGIITSSGSLGQGEGLGCGIALAKKIQRNSGKVYIIIGDGECNEGSVWEAMMFAKRYKLDNLVFIIDRNRLQSYGHDEEVLNMGDLNEKVKAFGFHTFDVDGHDVEKLYNAFEKTNDVKEIPCCIIANTVKGKGCSVFEDKVLWHYKWPEKEHYDQAMKELEQN